MSVLSQIMQVDALRIFEDWGVPAQLCETNGSYDVESGEVEEQSSTTPITVIPQQHQGKPVDATAATLQFAQRDYLMRKQDLPEGASLTSSHLEVDGVRYRILSVHESQVPEILLLHCIH